MTVWTIGHSTRTVEQFIAMLKAHQIDLLIDIRTVPRSARNPQFNRDQLPGSLAAHGIGYLHMAGLGGLRHARKDSLNTAWKNDSFRGYADYMQTSDFTRNTDDLIRIAQSQRVAVMCAEAVPWRCHRSLVADALTARGVEVKHIMTEASAKPHTLTSFACVAGEHVTYPGLPVPTVR